MADTDAVDVDADDLDKAVMLWTGRGARSWPHRDDAALFREFGEARGLHLLVTLQTLEADFYGAAGAHLMEPDLQAMTNRAAEEFRKRHPDASSALVDAFAWCYSFDHK